jgi:CO/xanthine dehydrogenase FAD-binding subunit
MYLVRLSEAGNICLQSPFDSDILCLSYCCFIETQNSKPKVVMTIAHATLPEFDYIKPKTAEKAVQFLKIHHSQSRPLLGGTDCLIAIRDGKISPKYLIDLKHLDGFNALSFDKDQGLTIGAAVSLNRLIESPEVQASYPLIADAAREVGGYQLRTRATLVGNLCNASPCGDTIGPCLVYESIVHIIGQKNERILPLSEFFIGPGQTCLEPGEIVKAICLPMPPTGAQSTYLSIGRNALSDLAIAAVTVLGYPDPSIPSGFYFRIALSAVAPTVIFALQAQDLLSKEKLTRKTIGKAAELAAQACKPIDDIRASARYRREMVHTLTRRALEIVIAKLGLQMES